MSRRRESGFTLIELLIVVAIIAIVAAISAVAFLSAIDRGRQKRTVNDMRQIAAAWEARATEVHSYSAAGYTFPTEDVAYLDLETALSPTYTRALPKYDAWNTPFEYAIGEPKEYAIRSAGRDKNFDGDTYEPGETTDFDCDIVYANGAFITFPVAVKTSATGTQPPQQ